MGILQAALAAAGFSTLLASGTGTVASPQRLDDAQSSPVITLRDEGLRTRFYDFGSDHKPKQTRQGLYDSQLGIACTWKLVAAPFKLESFESPLNTALYAVSGHKCSRGKEPTRWNEAPAKTVEDIGGLHLSSVIDVNGDRQQLAQVSLDIFKASKYGRLYMRVWDAAEHQVCIRSGVAIETPMGMQSLSSIQHGCFKMDKIEFLVQRAIALTPSSNVA